jgi:hypothetical protein
MARFLLKIPLVLLAAFLVIECYYQLNYGLGAVIPSFFRVYDFAYIDQSGTPRFPPSLSAWHKSYGDRPDVTVTFNSQGFRGPEPLASPSVRIAMLGDSMVFNGAVQDDESFPYLIQSSLRQSLHDPGIEVFNFGVGDIGASKYSLKLANHAVSYRPDLVVVFIYLNDSIEAMSYSKDWARQVQRPWYRSYTAENLLKLGRNMHLLYQAQRSERFNWVESFLSRSYLRDAGAWEKMVEAARFDWGSAWYEESWGVIEVELAKMRSLAQGQQAELLLVVLPVKPQLELPDSTPRLYAPQEFARRAAERLGIPLLDPLQFLRDVRDPDSLMYDQCHFTVAGNERFAQYLAPHLEEWIKASQAQGTARSMRRLRE